MKKEKIQYHILCKKGDVGNYVLLPGDPARVPIIAAHLDNSKKIAQNREFLTYTGFYKGIKISVTSTGVGAPSTSIAVEELANIGANTFIRIGTCGAMQNWLKPGDIIVATAAVRGDGTTREYIPEEYPAVADFNLVYAMKKAADILNIDRVFFGIIRTHDAFYIESPFAHGDYIARIRHWIDAGVLCVENESSAIFVIASIRRLRAGSVLVVRGNLVTGEQVRDPEKIRNRMEKAIDLALKSIELLERGEV